MVLPILILLVWESLILKKWIFIQDRISIDEVNIIRKKKKRKDTIQLNWACKTLLWDKKLFIRGELALLILYNNFSTKSPRSLTKASSQLSRRPSNPCKLSLLLPWCSSSHLHPFYRSWNCDCSLYRKQFDRVLEIQTMLKIKSKLSQNTWNYIWTMLSLPYMSQHMDQLIPMCHMHA